MAMRRRSPAESRLRRAHRERMSVWGLDADAGYENAVVGRALSALRGAEPPIGHPHALEEMGCCVECDAAAILSR